MPCEPLLWARRRRPVGTRTCASLGSFTLSDRTSRRRERLLSCPPHYDVSSEGAGGSPAHAYSTVTQHTWEGGRARSDGALEPHGADILVKVGGKCNTETIAAPIRKGAGVAHMHVAPQASSGSSPRRRGPAHRRERRAGGGRPRERAAPRICWSHSHHLQQGRAWPRGASRLAWTLGARGGTRLLRAWEGPY